MPCWRKKKKFDPNTFRGIYLNEYSEEDINISEGRKSSEKTRESERMDSIYPENVTKTSRYNVLNFLFIALFVHFSKLTNLYFLGMTILLVIPSISPFSIGSTLTPIIFITVVSLLRELIEDISRHSSDK